MMMRSTEPKYRWPLNPEQIEILELLYKFRFITLATVKDYFSESNPGMDVFRRLDTLENQSLIAKRYFDNYRLLHKPVVYYLLPAGARKLIEHRDKDDTDDINIKGIYRDGVVREQFAMHSVAVFKLYNRLTEQYGGDMDFFSRSDQAGMDDFPKPLPDAYVTLQADNEATRHFFVDILDDDAHLMADASKKIKRLIGFRRSGSWATTGSPFPAVIFVCNSDEASKRVQKRCEAALHKAWVFDMQCTATTVDTIELNQ